MPTPRPADPQTLCDSCNARRASGTNYACTRPRAWWAPPSLAAKTPLISQWELSVTNSSKSAYCLFSLTPSFFSRFKAHGDAARQRRGVKCQLYVKVGTVAGDMGI